MMDGHKVLLNRCALANFLVGHQQAIGVGDLWFAQLGSPGSWLPVFFFGKALSAEEDKGRNRSLSSLFTRLLPKLTTAAAGSTTAFWSSCSDDAGKLRLVGTGSPGFLGSE